MVRLSSVLRALSCRFCLGGANVTQASFKPLGPTVAVAKNSAIESLTHVRRFQLW